MSHPTSTAAAERMTGLGQNPNIHSQDQWENRPTHFNFCQNCSFPLEQTPVSFGSV